MLSQIQKFIKDFYDRNLFERIIIYIFLAELLVKIFVELVMGKQGFFASQERQYVFFALLALDYALCYRRIVDIRVSINPLSLFGLTIFIMVAHGLFVGIMNHNAPFIIFNDTVPLLMLGLNVLRMQSFAEMRRPIDIKFLFKSCVIIAAAVTFFGILAGDISIPNTAIFYPLILACIFMLSLIHI